jgi:uncharacterized protein
MLETSFPDIAGFEWNVVNHIHNRTKNDVENYEAEQVFFNKPMVILPDIRHSVIERRLSAFGMTDAGRQLTVVFTIRRSCIRIISARDMHKKEKEFFRKYGKENS